MNNLYYTAPSDEAFEDMRKACLEVWGQYKDSPGDYYKEKTGRLPEIGNVSGNFMYMFAMFDHMNQRKVADKLAPETKEAVRERLVAGGNPENFINQILGV